mmetsp:Transcript_34639/g.81669  ORF Transcript_34639/g.81669 Transcript_34639/m.81669 type:complete len:226 (+) Transcript_34639:134-811(+)
MIVPSEKDSRLQVNRPTRTQDHPFGGIGIGIGASMPHLFRRISFPLLIRILVLSSPEFQWLLQVLVLQATHGSHLSVLIGDPFVISAAVHHVVFGGVGNVLVVLLHGIIGSVETRLALSVVGGSVAQSACRRVVHKGIEFLEEIGDRTEDGVASFLLLGKELRSGSGRARRRCRSESLRHEQYCCGENKKGGHGFDGEHHGCIFVLVVLCGCCCSRRDPIGWDGE